MSTIVSRSLREINEEVVNLNKNISVLTKENKNLDKTLKLDPTNTELLVSKTKNLQDAISLAKQKIDTLKNAQIQMKQAILTGESTDEEYKRLSQEVAKAEVQVKSLNAELFKTSNTKLSNFRQEMQGIANVATTSLIAISGLGIAYAKTGDEIDNASKRYRISAEEFQKGKFIFDRATGNADSYENTLESITTQMAALEKGSVKAEKAFQMVGIRADEIKDKSPAQAIELLVNRLTQLENVEERASLASVILGSRGVEIAQVASLTKDEFSSLNEELEKAGILTSEEAHQAANLQDQIDDFTLSTKKAGAELAVSLIPLFNALLDLIEVIAPVLTTLANIFGAIPAPIQAIVAILLILLVTLPRLILMVESLNKVLLLLGMNPINLKIMLIVMAVAALILLLYELAKALHIFDKDYDLNIKSNINTVNGPVNFGDYMAGGRNSSIPSTNSTTHNYYYDYSTQNNNISKEVDIDDVASKLSNKIKIGGAR